jgi:hypothetical protein
MTSGIADSSVRCRSVPYLIVKDYDPSLIKKLVRKFVERWSGESWHEVAQKVARIGAWEFEDYPVPNPTKTPD